jgi:hypothetical protein
MHSTDSNVSTEARRRRHEHADPAVGQIALVVGAIVVTVVVSLVVSTVMMKLFGRIDGRRAIAQDQSALVAPSLAPLTRFPGPHLQVQPRMDLQGLRAIEDAQLTNYGWADRERGVVRIPIERAMELLAERGLPTRSTNEPVPVGRSSEELVRERGPMR